MFALRPGAYREIDRTVGQLADEDVDGLVFEDMRAALGYFLDDIAGLVDFITIARCRRSGQLEFRPGRRYS